MNRLRDIKILFLFLFAGNLTAQQLNLVPNPGFEYNLSSIVNKGYNQVREPKYPLTYGWIQPTTGTSDFWNSPECKVKMKKNGWVMQMPPARTGKAHAGLLLNSHRKFNFSRKVYGEYLQTRLLEPLQQGQSYYFECYVMLDQKSGWSAPNIGAYFSSDAITSPNYYYLKETPQVVNTDQHLLAVRGEWKKISGFFTARGNEKYMTVGTFVYPGACVGEKKLPHIQQPGDSDLEEIAYYFFDDFLLVPVNTPAEKKEKSPEDHITMLVDISNSMYMGNHVQALKKKAGEFIQEQGANTRITLITFGSGIEMRAYARQFNDTTVWNQVMNGFGPSGGTNIARAIDAGFDITDSLQEVTGRNRLVLFTDAKFDLDRATQRNIKKHINANEIEFDLYQFGDFYNKALDKTITHAGGNYQTAAQKDLLQLLQEKPSCDCGKQFERRLKWGKGRKLRCAGVIIALSTVSGILIAQ